MSERETTKSGNFDAAYRKHERRWKNNRYVYAVVSRRSRGISIGINLNPGKECNFRCVYCQVDRSVRPADRVVNLDRLALELGVILQAERRGSLYNVDPFRVLPPEERGVRDIAFSGDGEPTAFPYFDRAVDIAVDARNSFRLDSAKIVLITNAAYLDKPGIAGTLSLLDENNGEIWAKLDAGTEEYFKRVNRPDASLERILDNILNAARLRPLVIQTLWVRLHDTIPPDSEIEAYCGNLNRLLASGGFLKRVQFHTIARTPSEQFVSALSDTELDRIADSVRGKVPVNVEVFYGVDLRRDGGA